MKAVIIIPARYGSTRYPGKPLVELRTREGKKSLIQLSWEAACKVSGITEIYVATDDKRIEEHAITFGAKVIRTSSKCKNGTERCAEAVNNAQLDAEIIVNFQGDAPLTPSWFVEEIIAGLKADKSVDMATPVLRLDRKSYNLFSEDRKSVTLYEKYIDSNSGIIHGQNFMSGPFFDRFFNLFTLEKFIVTGPATDEFKKFTAENGFVIEYRESVDGFIR